MRIGVVGTGIAGLGAAYALSRAHDVELFEEADWIGGHTHTIVHDVGGKSLALDTGFIVMNERNYPNLVRLFRELGVRTQDSEMSLSVSCESCGIQYSGRRPFAQPANALRPSFLRMLTDIVRFLRQDHSDVSDEVTLEQYARDRQYSYEFQRHFLIPLAAAIWSTPPAGALAFPAAYALRFFDNHGLLTPRYGLLGPRMNWRTVVGGSHTYVRAILDRIDAPIHIKTPVRTLRRTLDGVSLTTAAGRSFSFDKVVIATHPDQALRLLADPSDQEQRILGSFRFAANETVLHTDARFLPRPAARASWNYQLLDCHQPSAQPTMTYYLNRLQSLDEAQDYCVTLNREREIPEDAVIARVVYEHPQYTAESLRAQQELPSLNGQRHTAFCGAYQGFGFHEDGLVSGLRAAAAHGVSW